MKTILYIHGAFSSGLSFQRIREKLPSHRAILAEYTVDNSIESNIQYVADLVRDIDGPIDIVSHSMGGIIGIAVAQQNPNINSIVTISTPFGGSKVADLLRWFSGHELYRSLNGQNLILKDLISTPLSCKHRCIVTTVGNNPMMYDANDGVVSLKSQLAVPHAEIIKVPLNHFEVLLSDTTIDLVRDFTFGTNATYAV